MLLGVEIGLARLWDPFLSEEVYSAPSATSNVRFVTQLNSVQECGD